ncbi:hypothetical protein [Winogradskyella sp.]|uniref:hypothetical protein n=1 Tax=Winogradskyella sp. TaxID=1883156 RepID=UPI00351326D9
MTVSEKIKFYLIKTPLAKPIRDIEGRLILSKIKPKDSKVANRKTVYCISPYKTGTTYLASCFNKDIAQHEPIHYASYKSLDSNFDEYFVKRLNYLNLKLECSGSWSAYIDELSNHKIAKDLEYICVFRAPSSWVTSVINFWNKPSMLEFSFDIPLEYFWKQKVGVNLRDFEFSVHSEKNQEIIYKLIEYYLDFTAKTAQLKNMTYIRLKELKSSLPLVESLIEERAKVENSWQRANKKKPFVYKNDLLDKEYKRLTEDLINKRNKKMAS